MIPIVHDCGQLTVADLFLLSLIAGGIDSRSELVKASGIAERRVYKRLRMLSCDPWMQDGKLRCPENPALVQMRKHPHQAGMQLFITAEGEQLLSAMQGLHVKRAPVLA